MYKEVYNMAKKIVRGITDVKTINNQDFDTNNVNDLLSDGEYNYIHRKKGKSEEYHNLTDNIKTLSSDNTELLSVTNNNKTTNTATLHPKHDAQKEQVLESERNTVTINHGTNGTAEKTTVDTNPQKVLEHSNLLTDYGISKTTSGNTTKLGLEYTKAEDGFDLNNLENGNLRGERFVNSPDDGQWFFVSSAALSGGNYVVQQAIRVVDSSKYTRNKNNGNWSAWKEQVGDKSAIDALLAQKQDVLTAGDGITIQDQTIGLKTIDNYSGDLNELTETCLVRPTNNAVNLPFVGAGDGILTVVKIADTVSQQYHNIDNIVFTRVRTFWNGALRWSKWTCVTPVSPSE